MHALAGGVTDDLLPPFAQQDALARHLGVFLGNRNDVATADLGVEAEEQVRRAEHEEMQRVRLHDLPIMHEAAHLVRARRRRGRADDMVERLGRGELVRDGADAAEALHHDRRLPIGPALHEFFEAAKFDDMQPRLLHLTRVVHEQRDLAMAFDARDRVDGDAAQLLRFGGGFEFEGHDAPLVEVTERIGKIRRRAAHEIGQEFPERIGGGRTAAER